MSNTATVNKKSELTGYLSVVLADTSGNARTILASAETKDVPTEFEILKVGAWTTPYHGDILVMPQDLQEYYDNWTKGVAVPGYPKQKKLPLNYGHESWEKAAAWFGLVIRGETLWAVDVDWTPAGKQSVLDGEWRHISGEFCPRGRGGWENPLNEGEYVENVMTGAALTNIPLFGAELAPIMASAVGGEDKPKVSLLIASEHKEIKNMPTLEEVLVKKNDELTDEERQVLTDNQEKLTPEQKTAFGFEGGEPAPVVNENKEVEENKVPEVAAPELAEVAASIKAGTHVVVKADTLARLEETDKQYREEKALATVNAHVARGAIKSESSDSWKDRLLNASAKERAQLEKDLADLNGNDLLASTVGSAANAAETTEAASLQVKAKADELIKADASMSMKSAIEKVLSEDQDLAKKYDDETRGV